MASQPLMSARTRHSPPLVARDPAAHAVLGDPHAVAAMLEALQEVGAQEQAALLADRLPTAGLFDLFSDQGPSDAVPARP